MYGTNTREIILGGDTMIGYKAFVRKEFLECIRTYKLFVMLFIFVIFGIMSPFFAKLTPELLSMLSNTEDIQINLQLPEPSALDSYVQFFKNVTQMGLVIFILVFNGLLAVEVSKGTLIPIVTRGLARSTVILAKFTVASLVWSICYVVALGITLGYTIWLFPSMNLHYLVLSLCCAWIFGIFLIALFLCMSSLTSGNYGGLLGSVIFIGVLMLINIVPVVQAYNPISLISENTAMLQQGFVLSDIVPAIVITIIGIVAFVILAITSFKKKLL